MHRIDQNKVTIGSKEVLEKFDEVEDKILSLRRRRKS